MNIWNTIKCIWDFIWPAGVIGGLVGESIVLIIRYNRKRKKMMFSRIDIFMQRRTKYPKSELSLKNEF